MSRTVSCLVGSEGQTRHESHPGLSPGRPREPGFIFLSHHSPETHVLAFLAGSFLIFKATSCKCRLITSCLKCLPCACL